MQIAPYTRRDVHREPIQSGKVLICKVQDKKYMRRNDTRDPLSQRSPENTAMAQ